MFSVKCAGAAILISMSVVPYIINYIQKRKHKKELHQLKQHKHNYYYQCIFFGEKNFECRPHVMENQICGEYCSMKNLSTLTAFIASAQISVSVSVLTLQLLNIGEELVKAQKRGLRVRLILDIEMLRNDCPRLKRILHSGIKVKTQDADGSYLHHKFCLTDVEDKNLSKMFFGSLNLTMQGIVSNFEHLILTNDLDIIQRFNEEFEEMWKHFRDLDFETVSKHTIA